MKNMASLKFVYPSGSMREKVGQLLSLMKVFIDEVTLNGPICLMDLDLKSAMISEIDSFRSQDIPVLIEGGAFDLGLVGIDWIRERESKVKVVKTLCLSRSTFEPVKIVLAAPTELNLQSVVGLPANGVIATEYPVTARAYLDRKNRKDLQILLSYGDTERKPGLGVADGIIDIVETGQSLERSRLSIIEVIAISKIAIVANLQAFADPAKGPAIRKFAQMIQDCYRLMLLEERK